MNMRDFSDLPEECPHLVYGGGGCFGTCFTRTWTIIVLRLSLSPEEAMTSLGSTQVCITPHYGLNGVSFRSCEWMASNVRLCRLANSIPLSISSDF